MLVADIYAAGEAPIEGVTATRWSPACARTAIATSAPSPARASCAALVAELAQPGDFVVCLGAGSITNWANACRASSRALRKTRAGAR